MAPPTQPPHHRVASSDAPANSGGQIVTLGLAWLGVGLPLAWGVLETLRKAMALFQ
jgi:hypothetical protein